MGPGFYVLEAARPAGGAPETPRKKGLKTKRATRFRIARINKDRLTKRHDSVNKKNSDPWVPRKALA